MPWKRGSAQGLKVRTHYELHTHAAYFRTGSLTFLHTHTHTHTHTPTGIYVRTYLPIDPVYNSPNHQFTYHLLTSAHETHPHVELSWPYEVHSRRLRAVRRPAERSECDLIKSA